MELREIINQYRKQVLSLDQVVGLGRGFKEISGEKTSTESIQVLVKKKKPLSQLKVEDIVPEKLAGVLTDVIEVGEITAFGERTERSRPAQPGISIGHYQISAGTFGAVVYDLKSAQPLILSNNHILANTSSTARRNAKSGDPILQPASYDGGQISDDILAYLERYVPLKIKGSERSELAEINLVDCAVALPIDASLISSEIIGIGQVNGVSAVKLGDQVQKSGRTTGLTTGLVRTLDATVIVDMGSKEEAIFGEQIIIDSISEGGDSGSLVLNLDNQAIGLLFAGSKQVTVCNAIDTVLRALDIRF